MFAVALISLCCIRSSHILVMFIMESLDDTVGLVKKAMGTIGTMQTVFKMLKKMPGTFGTIFALAYNFFLTIDVSSI